MRRICVLVLVYVAVATAARAQTLQLAQPVHDAASDVLTWEYTVTVTAAETFVIELTIPQSDDVGESLTPADPMKVSSVVHKGTGRWEFVATDATTLSLTVTAPKTRFKNTNGMRYGWNVAGQPPTTGISGGPTLLLDPSRVRLVFGGGLTVRRDDVVDFTIDEDTSTLFVVNDSRGRPAGILGGLFTFKRFKDSERSLDALVSLEFTNDTTRILDGFLFGVTYSINSTFAIGAGISARMGEELGPGFRRAAIAAVAEAPADSPLKRFSSISDDDEAYDGLPIVTAGGEDVFPRDQVIKRSVNTSYFIGVFVPIDLVSTFRNLGGSR